MFPGMNPRDVKKAMKKMGVAQKDIDAVEVIIKTEDKEIVFRNPQVAEVTMMGQRSYQIIGEPIERELSSEPEITEDDVSTVAEQAGVSKEDAERALKEAEGDLAKAIMLLQD